MATQPLDVYPRRFDRRHSRKLLRFNQCGYIFVESVLVRSLPVFVHNKKKVCEWICYTCATPLPIVLQYQEFTHTQSVLA